MPVHPHHLLLKTQKQNQQHLKRVRRRKKTIRRLFYFLGIVLRQAMGLDPSEAYPAWIQHKLDSLGKGYQVVNAGLKW